ncbi:hypothetical protein GCM10010349_31340 [Streptomyces flavofungini]|nr:hypothetical protein GCM10010349_31340 [Streptomyces flavofungini]
MGFRVGCCMREPSTPRQPPVLAAPCSITLCRGVRGRSLSATDRGFLPVGGGARGGLAEGLGHWEGRGCAGAGGGWGEGAYQVREM